MEAHTSFLEEELLIPFQKVKNMSSYWLVKNIFLAYKELNKHEILSIIKKKKLRSFGYPQSEEVLLMKSGASNVHTIVVML